MRVHVVKIEVDHFECKNDHSSQAIYSHSHDFPNLNCCPMWGMEKNVLRSLFSVCYKNLTYKRPSKHSYTEMIMLTFYDLVTLDDGELMTVC